MAEESPDPNPFGELSHDARDRLPPPKTAGQVASGVIGFVVMGIGGLLVGAAILIRLAGGSLWIVVLPLGLGVCYLGYWLYNRGRVRTRRTPRAARDRRDRDEDEDDSRERRRGRRDDDDEDEDARDPRHRRRRRDDDE
jgi:hypothetical protein